MEDPSQKILRKRKPFRLLAKLSADELSQFRYFLVSPLVHPKPDKKLVAFFDHCLATKVWASDLDKPTFEKLTKLSHNDNAFNKLVSELYGQLTKFAATVAFLKSSTGEQTPYALKFYGSQGIEQVELDKKVKEGKRELINAVQDEQYFRKMLELELETAENAVSRALTPEERGLPNLHAHLDSYYFIMKLRFLCASANEVGIFGDADSSAVDEMHLQWLSANYDRMPAMARIFFHALYILIDQDAETHLQNFNLQMRKWEEENQAQQNRVEFVELNGYLLNYYLRKLNLGHLDAISQAHHFYMEALRNGWILENGRISPEHFKNIMVLKCRLDLLTEAHAFWDQYKDLLTDDHGGAAIAYNEILLGLYQQNFKQMIPKLEALIDAKGSIKADHYYGLDLRCQLLKTYFECLTKADSKTFDELDEKLGSLLNAFPSYILRKNLPQIVQIRYENFRRSIQRLYNCAFDLPDKERRAKKEELLKDFRSSSNLPDKTWFIQKAQAI